MINVGIVGADTPMAGELLRILVNHPDVELIALCAPGKKGLKVESVHHGLVGECDMSFSEFIDPEKIDVVFIDAHSALADHFRRKDIETSGLKIIDMSHGPIMSVDSDNVYALSEINRRILVHDAQRAVVPRSIAAVSILGMLPLADHMMLPSEINLEITAPDDITVLEKLLTSEREIEYWLSKLQASFSGKVNLIIKDKSDSLRGIRIKTRIPINAELEVINQMYQQRYNDHTLTFAGNLPTDFKQVEGTDKCLIHLDKDAEGNLVVEAVADCRMRGGAGDAVHAMNLMFGLIETTGLRLKAHVY